ncbi:HEPN domain-containing protein [Armatimonas sp.]|uniref:HEPN domain-containing protein n=1 Tax=Armatimonas sp. TaxID=1872638 RepID=UPI0037527317
MTQQDFQQLALERLADSQALLAAGRWGGAYYLAGYSVECALKACIAKKTQQGDFPSKDAPKFYTHNLVELLSHCGLGKPIGRESEWAIVRDWNEQSRYDPPKSQQDAKDIIVAITDQQKGILSWLQTQW